MGEKKYEFSLCFKYGLEFFWWIMEKLNSKQNGFVIYEWDECLAGIDRRRIVLPALHLIERQRRGLALLGPQSYFWIVNGNEWECKFKKIHNKFLDILVHGPWRYQYHFQNSIFHIAIRRYQLNFIQSCYIKSKKTFTKDIQLSTNKISKKFKLTQFPPRNFRTVFWYIRIFKQLFFMSSQFPSFGWGYEKKVMKFEYEILFFIMILFLGICRKNSLLN
jgi:hypothetical protein